MWYRAFYITGKIILLLDRRWREILKSNGWGDAGLYVNGKLQISPESAMECLEPIFPNQWYYVVMSRDKKGLVKLYLNGYL